MNNSTEATGSETLMEAIDSIINNEPSATVSTIEFYPSNGVLEQQEIEQDGGDDEVIPDSLPNSNASEDLEVIPIFSPCPSPTDISPTIQALEKDSTGVKEVLYDLSENRFDWPLTTEQLILRIPAIPELLPSRIVIQFGADFDQESKPAESAGETVSVEKVVTLPEPTASPESVGTAASEVLTDINRSEKPSEPMMVKKPDWMAKIDKEEDGFDYGVFESPFSRPVVPIPAVRNAQPPQLHSAAVKKRNNASHAATKPAVSVILRKKLKPSQKRPWCWNCKQLGHERPQCPLRVEQGIVNYTCFRCGKDGKTCRSCTDCGGKWRKQGPFRRQTKQKPGKRH